MIKLFIFDLDGTLVHLPIRYNEIRKKLQLQFHTNNKFSPLLHSINQFCKNKKELKKAYEIITNEEMKAVEKFVPRENSIDLLQSLKSKRYSLGLVTLQGIDVANMILTTLKISHLFDTIITREDAIIRETQISKTLDIQKVSPNEGILVGDRLNDVESAKNVGCKSILVGNHPTNLSSDVLKISRFDELIDRNF